MNTSRPYSKNDLLDSLYTLRTDGLSFWFDFTPKQFASPIGTAWSPADNLRHLARATTPVSFALRLPRIALGAMFGTATDPSRTFDDLRTTYLGVLSEGAKAGRFAPAPVTPPRDLGVWQEQLVGRCARAINSVERAIAPWSETALDRYRLPHPLLGRLTVREMLLFTLYHYEHHKANVIRRMAASERPPN